VSRTSAFGFVRDSLLQNYADPDLSIRPQSIHNGFSYSDYLRDTLAAFSCPFPDLAPTTTMARDSSALSRALTAALKSRESRGILRRLPDPIPSTTTTQSAQIDFTSNDYLSLTRSVSLRETVLQRLRGEAMILGTGGSRLLLNPPEFASFEQNLTSFLGTTEQDGHHTEALLFNSGFDANVSLFSCIPQPEDHVVYDEYIHASVHDGLRASRLPKSSVKPFIHNDLDSLHQRLSELGDVQGSVFVAVESLYSMDGTFAPLQDIISLLETIFPRGNGYLIVDEAHSTGIYGAEGRGRVAECGLNGHPLVLARLHTFGKALGGSGGTYLICRRYSHFNFSLSCPHTAPTSPKISHQLRKTPHLYHISEPPESCRSCMLIRIPQVPRSNTSRPPFIRPDRIPVRFFQSHVNP